MQDLSNPTKYIIRVTRADNGESSCFPARLDDPVAGCMRIHNAVQRAFFDVGLMEYWRADEPENVFEFRLQLRLFENL